VLHFQPESAKAQDQTTNAVPFNLFVPGAIVSPQTFAGQKMDEPVAPATTTAPTRLRTIIVFGALFAVFGAVLVLAYLASFSRPVTTVILVRHAEKVLDPNNQDPDLTPAGQQRALEIARMFSGAGVNAIYATQFKRTQQTVKPLAEQTGTPITTLNSNQTDQLVNQIVTNHRGQTIFIAGHNNTVPAIISALTGENYPVIPESEYDNLYLVTIYRVGKAKVMKLKYGQASTQGVGTGTMVSPK
jgi:broad specificity phosphatase PhoE